MINLTCSKCSFTFSEADKAWDDAIDNTRCPKCLLSHPSWDLKNKGSAHNFQVSSMETKLTSQTTCLRILISLVAWASSFVAIYFSYSTTFSSPISWSNFIFGYPWIALFIMNVGWAKNHRLHPFWPISGTVVGLLATALSTGFGLLFAPLTYCLAIWLVIYHLDIKIKDVLKRI